MRGEGDRRGRQMVRGTEEWFDKGGGSNADPGTFPATGRPPYTEGS